MNPDDLKRAWQTQSSQTRLSIDPELLLTEFRRNQRRFSATIFRRDVREVGLALLMAPLWVFLGAVLSLPWGWYLMVPVLLWYAGYMLAYRLRHRRQWPGPDGSLREGVERSLAELGDQIRLLRSVFWWGLLPFAVASTAFFLQIFWQDDVQGWWAVVAFALLVAFVSVVLAWVYWLNRRAVRSELEPRRRELKALLASLQEETPAAGGE